MTTAKTATEPHDLPPLDTGEAARYFVPARYPELDCLTATFTTYAYAPHSHDTYVIGTVTHGVEVWTVRGRRHRAGPGDLAFVMPRDVHDGAPDVGGYSYRMTYPSESRPIFLHNGLRNNYQ